MGLKREALAALWPPVASSGFLYFCKQLTAPIYGTWAVKQPPEDSRLLPELELFGQRLIARGVRFIKVIQQATPLAYHL
jgi:hypothetical protein